MRASDVTNRCCHLARDGQSTKRSPTATHNQRAARVVIDTRSTNSRTRRRVPIRARHSPISSTAQLESVNHELVYAPVRIEPVRRQLKTRAALAKLNPIEQS